MAKSHKTKLKQQKKASKKRAHAVLNRAQNQICSTARADLEKQITALKHKINLACASPKQIRSSASAMRKAAERAQKQRAEARAVAASVRVAKSAQPERAEKARLLLAARQLKRLGSGAGTPTNSKYRSGPVEPIALSGFSRYRRR